MLARSISLFFLFDKYTINISRRAFIGDDFSRYPHHHAVVGDVVGDNAVSTYSNIVANGDLPEDFRAWTNVNVIPNHRHARAFAPPADSDGNIVGKVAIFSYDHILIGNDAAVMTDVKTRSNFGFEGNGNAKLDLEAVIDQPGKREKDAPKRVGMRVRAKPHPPGVAISGGEQVVKEAIFEGGAARVAEEVGSCEGGEFRKFHG